ncbi:hypothetical protein Drose_05660 [Dactylosporangium roseum]|uniref:Uncharacterized protein n=1 Tax=Dactylosporangium roseum TaxID=47989 RepID=A0ABY5Z878_9ACTN|nr:hypothetical protein [Dactylosporangium roseum]UWZ37756.1 hypothetical protein Drose_05660 [Dactylosporangium roseum]
MTSLSWTEQCIAEEFAGAVLSLASLCAHRPQQAEQLRLAAVARLDEQGRALLAALAGQIEEGS